MEHSSHTQLYQQLILHHNKNPKNFFKMEAYTHFSEGFNPLCGDRYTVYLKVEKDKISDISFDGDGCAISKSSGSLMTVVFKEQSISSVSQQFSSFQKMILGKQISKKEEKILGKLMAFQGIKNYPSRIKCAILCWHALKAALSLKNRVSTENSVGI